MLLNSRIPYHSGRNGPGFLSVETLCDLTCFDASSSCEFGEKGFDAAFENEISRTLLNYSYSGTLQIMALTSVLGVPIQTVYPDQNHKLLPVYENVFQPRQGRHSANNVFVRILWTNTRGWPDRSKEFTVNLFVTLFKRGDEVFNAQKTARKLTKETKPWHVFVQTKQSKQQTDRKAFEQHSKKITENAKHNKKESQSDEISGKSKSVKGKRESTLDLKDSPHKLGKIFQRTEHNEGNGNIQNREGRRTTAQQSEKKTQQTKENFNQKTRIKRSQQQLKTETSKKKDEVKKAQAQENQGQSEEKPPRVQEEKRDRLKNKEQKNEEKSEEKPALVQEEKRDRTKNKKQKNEEKSEEKPPLVQEEKRDRPKNKEQKNKEKSEEKPPLVQEEKRDRPKNKEQKNEEKSEEKPPLVQEEKRDRPKNKEQKNKEKSEEKPPLVQEEKRDRPKNKEQKKEEKSEEKPPLVQEEKKDRPKNKERKNEEKLGEKPPRVQEEKRDRPKNKEEKNKEKEMKKKGKQARFRIGEHQNDQSNGQETFKPQRTSTINGKKRKHAMLFDMNDSKSDSCSSAKKNIHTPYEAAIKFVQDRSALPFPCASRRFYLRQNRKAVQNAKRTKRRQELPVLYEDSKLIGLQRSIVEGSLEQKIESIKKEVNSCTNKTRCAELWAVVDVAMELQKSVLLETSTAATIYKRRKASLTNKEESSYFRPIDTYEKLSKHINIAQIYIDQKAFIVEAKDTDIRKVVEIVSDTLEKLYKHTAREKVHSCLKDNFRDVLQYLDSKRDRDVLEAVIAKITSVKSVVSIKGTKFKGSVSKHRATLDSTLNSFKEINQSCQTVRNDMTVAQQHAKFQREKEKIKNEQLKVVAKGREESSSVKSFQSSHNI